MTEKNMNGRSIRLVKGDITDLDVEGIAFYATAVLQNAEEKSIRRLALPAMGTGFYGIPLELCARVMVKTLREDLNGNSKIEQVTICARDAREIAPFARQIEQV